MNGLTGSSDMTAFNSFNEQPCDILKGTDLSNDAYYTSTAFIPTMRLKEWKPVDRSRMKADRSYCYIDQDEKCDDYKEHAPFITSVFQDAAQDITRSMPTKKCVIEIDPATITNDNLDTYWKNMGKTECGGVVLKLQKENANLQEKIENVANVISDLELSKTNNTATTSKNNEVLGHLGRAIDETKASIERVNSEIETKRQLYSNLEANMSTSAASCRQTLGELNTNLGKCVTELRYWTGEYNNSKKSYATLNPLYQTQQVMYNTNDMALQNMISQYDNLVDKHDKLVLRYNILNDNNVQCNDGLAACTTSYRTCSNNDVQAVNNGALKYGIWNSCMASAATCSNDNTRCLTENIRLTPINTETIQSYQVCMNQYEKCQDSLTKDKVTSAGLKANIDEWLKTHVECNRFIPLIDGVKESIKAIMIWCKLPMDMMVNNQKGFTDVQITAVQSVANQVAACEASVNLIPVIPPEPPKAPVNPIAPAEETEVTTYSELNFQGAKTIVKLGSYVNGDNLPFSQDAIMSIKVPVGKQATIWKDNYNGPTKILKTGAYSDLGELNKNISSIKVETVVV